ncbi:MAG TPA: P-loop NTPase fold protein [Pyrinomonadaceae bacterium]|nr:P-loop NTPase fold protein [Pyrinomonadaceae bacterium]
MWRDSESDQDFLNFTEVADQIVALTQNANMLPMSIGMFGTWGTGKSTVLRLVENRLPKKGKHAVIKFDAWLYQGFDDARAALMEVVSTKLLELSKDNKTLLQKANDLAGRVNYFRALGLAADVGVSLAFGIPPGFISRGINALSLVARGEGTTDDINAVKKDAKEAVHTLGGLLKPAEKKTPPKEIEAFRKEFGELLEGLDTTLILFIDNLDRCLPDVAIATLEAVRLFLFMPRTAFIIAADEDMIRHSVAKHFNDPQASHVRDYLDKVIQVPMRVPQVSAEDLRAYMYSLYVSLASPESLTAVQERLLNALQGWWSGKTFTKEEIVKMIPNSGDLIDRLAIADRLAPTLASAPQIQGNPRIVKRLMNAISLRQQIAKGRGMNVDLATLAKLAVFERCTSEDATRTLYGLVMEDAESQSYLLPPSESKKKAMELPETWKKFEPFIRDWQRMEPLFDGKIDLKPAVFLSRDVMAPAVTHRGLSPAAQEAVAALTKVASVNSPAAQKVVTSLSAPERAAVMSQLIDNMRQADWAKHVDGIHGALILAKDDPTLSAELKAFVSGLSQKSMDKGILFLLKNAEMVETK